MSGPAIGGIVVGWSIRAPFFVYAATLSLATVVALVFLRPHPNLMSANLMSANLMSAVAATIPAALSEGSEQDPVAVYLLAMAVLGVGTAFLGSAPTAIVGDVVGGRRGGTVVATFQMISDVGAIAGPLIAGFLADRAGFHWAFASGVAISLLAALFAFAMPETRKRSR